MKWGKVNLGSFPENPPSAFSKCILLVPCHHEQKMFIFLEVSAGADAELHKIVDEQQTIVN